MTAEDDDRGMAPPPAVSAPALDLGAMMAEFQSTRRALQAALALEQSRLPPPRPRPARKPSASR